MTEALRRSYTVTLIVAVSFGVLVPAEAASPRVRIARPMALAAPRTVRATSTHGIFAPFLMRRSPVHAAPIAALPLIFPARVKSALPALLPRIGIATLVAPFDLGACADRRSTTLLATIPTSPFTPLACRPVSARGDDMPATNALVPGGNKKALYGPAYSPAGGADP